MLPTVTGVLAVSNLHCRSFGFSKSKAMITGQIGPVVRARVSDLASLDPDRPAGPAQRATWENALSFFLDSGASSCILDMERLYCSED